MLLTVCIVGEQTDQEGVVCCHGGGNGPTANRLDALVRWAPLKGSAACVRRVAREAKRRELTQEVTLWMI